MRTVKRGRGEDDAVNGVRLTRGVKRAVAASEADGCAGVGDALGRLVGRARAGKMGRVGWPVGLAGWRGPSGWLGGLLLLFLFLFFISFPLFEFKFGLEFEFKTEVTYLLEF